MAGDWLKMRIDLQSHPKVVRILSATKADKFRVIGGLHAVWSVFDVHSEDGILHGYTPETLDHIIGWDGFSAAMIAVGWLCFDGAEALIVPEFQEHNGKSAKRRAEDQKRKRDSRNGPQDVRKMSEEKRTREEKRREDSNTPKSPKSKSRQSEKIGLKEFQAACREIGEKPLPEDDPVFDYALRIGLPEEFLRLAWLWFARKYAEKKQAGINGWRQTFRNAVEGNWPKYWFQGDDGGWQLTTAGKQAQADLQAATPVRAVA